MLDFVSLARDNLSFSDDVLNVVGEPIKVSAKSLKGGRTSLDDFAVALAASVSLMFITLLLAAGMLAIEREENAFSRLVRGLVSHTGLLVEKAGLAAVCSTAVCLLMLAGFGLFVHLQWSRFGLWVVAMVGGALAFAALGLAIGALTREVRAASLLAFMLSLPLAFLALVPSGAVAPALYDVIRAVSAIFPFKPTLDALDAALNNAGGLGAAAAPPGRAGGGLRGAGPLGLRRFADLSRGRPLDCNPMAFPATRMRRLRKTGVLRDMVRETELSASRLVYPMFVQLGEQGRTPIEAMPGIDRVSISQAVEDAGEVHELGVPAVLLFGLPADKDDQGSGAYDDEGVVQLAVRALKEAHPDLRGRDRRLPVRLHQPRPLRRPARRRQRRQRQLARPAGPHRRLARARGRGCGGAQRHDGRARRGPAHAARRRGLQGPADHRLLGQVRLRLLRAVSRGRRLRALVRRQARLPDGPGQRRGGRPRGAARRERGRRRRDGQAGAALPRRDPPRQGGHARAGGRLQRRRRVRDGQGRRGARLARRARRPCSRRSPASTAPARTS